MKYLFEVQSGYGTTLIEYELETLSTSFVQKDYVIQLIKNKINYYENATIKRGLLNIADEFMMPDIETFVDGVYIKHIKGVLYTLDKQKRLIKYILKYAGITKNWVRLYSFDNGFFESSTKHTRSRDCRKVELLGTGIKSIEQAKRIILLRG